MKLQIFELFCFKLFWTTDLSIPFVFTVRLYVQQTPDVSVQAHIERCEQRREEL
jgi:hypothetical protein